MGRWGETRYIIRRLTPCSVCDSNDTWQREIEKETEREAGPSCIPLQQCEEKQRPGKALLSNSSLTGKNPALYHIAAQLPRCATATLPWPISPPTPDAQRCTLTRLCALSQPSHTPHIQWKNHSDCNDIYSWRPFFFFPFLSFLVFCFQCV